MRKKNYLIIYENYLYGGTTTHLINLVNSKEFKKTNITILTNSDNEGGMTQIREIAQIQ